jgi:hypothetical protein
MNRIRTPVCGRPVLVALITSCLAVAAAGAARADAQHIAASHAVAVSGYDPVAYFAEGRALVGQDTIALRWRGQRWHFENERNRAAFEADPRAYVPAFKGLCVVALGEGRKVRGDPREWVVHDGRLYLFESASERRRLETNPAELLSAAREVWAEMHRDE